MSAGRKPAYRGLWTRSSRRGPGGFLQSTEQSTRWSCRTEASVPHTGEPGLLCDRTTLATRTQGRVGMQGGPGCLSAGLPPAASHLPGDGERPHWRATCFPRDRAPVTSRWPVTQPWTLTTNGLLTFSRICFSLRAMDSPFLFLILFFSKRLQAYIFPVARTWQAQTCGARRNHG